MALLVTRDRTARHLVRETTYCPHGSDGAMGTALITGASSGLGAEYAKLFAADKHDVVLVARRRDRLEALARELRSAHGVTAQVVAADLAVPEGAARLVEEVGRLGRPIDFLVNNAGF